MIRTSVYRERNIRGNWDKVAAGIEKINSVGPGHMGWTINHVLTELLRNDKGCKLYFIEKDGNYAGFFILRFFLEEFSRAPVCHVWLTYLEKNSSGLLTDISEFINEEAARHRCKFIRMESNRPGWERVLKKFGGVPWMTIYQKEICYG